MLLGGACADRLNISQAGLCASCVRLEKVWKCELRKGSLTGTVCVLHDCEQGCYGSLHEQVPRYP